MFNLKETSGKAPPTAAPEFQTNFEISKPAVSQQNCLGFAELKYNLSLQILTYDEPYLGRIFFK